MKESNVFLKGYTLQEVKNRLRALAEKLQQERENQLKIQKPAEEKENAQ